MCEAWELPGAACFGSVSSRDIPSQQEVAFAKAISTPLTQSLTIRKSVHGFDAGFLQSLFEPAYLSLHRSSLETATHRDYVRWTLRLFD